MKLIITILLFSLNASATNYYISNTGSDAANGTTTGTPWQTIAKVNAVTFSAGDSVLFKRGDTWNERLVFPSSGASGNPIVIGAYGSGADPIITGFQSISLLQNGNIWSAVAVASVAKLNTVLVDGQMKAKGRYPNSTYLTFTSYSGKTQITGSLTGTPNYTGAEIVIRTSHWVIDVSKVTSQSGGTLNFSPEITYTPSFNGNGYFFQNDSTLCDTNGEWYFDSTTKKFGVYSTTTPSVQISTIDTLVWLGEKNYLTFDNISFTGANKAAFQLDTSRHITIQNCSINYSGTLGISGAKSEYASILNNSIQNSLSGGIYLRRTDPFTPMQDTCNNATITGNYIKNSAIYAGMGLSNNGRYNAVSVLGTSTFITNNVIDSTGYLGIIFGGTNSLIKNNYVTNYCFVKDDGGGIYTVIGSYIPASYNDGSIIRSNIVINGTGAPAGTNSTSYAAGLYMDDFTKNITIDSNYIATGYNAAVFFNRTTSITFKDNTIVDSMATCMRIFSSGSTFNFKRNVYYQKKTSTYCFWYVTDATSSIDSNYYLRPVLEAGKIKGASDYSLAQWTAATGYDANGSNTPSGITAALPLIYYNTTQSATVTDLTGTYISAKGVTYNNSITLQPFASAVLFKTTNDIPVPPNLPTIRNSGFTTIRSL